MFKFEIYRDLATHDLVLSARITETDLYHVHKMMEPCELDLMNVLQKGTAADGFYWIAEMARALEEYDKERAAQGGAGVDPKDGEVETDSQGELRVCRGCGQPKPSSEFKGLFGHNGYCDKCVSSNFNTQGLIKMGEGNL